MRYQYYVFATFLGCTNLFFIVKFAHCCFSFYIWYNKSIDPLTYKSITRFYCKVFIFVMDILIFSTAIIMTLYTHNTRQMVMENLEKINYNNLVSELFE